MQFPSRQHYHPISEELIMSRKENQNNQKITKIGITNDTLTSRGGLLLFARYLESIKCYSLLTAPFTHIRRSAKGLSISNIMKQILCFFFDGSSRHINQFDELKKDSGYTASLENLQNDMASSHQIKRFFRCFSCFSGAAFRKILKMMFIWRLLIVQPKEIHLTIDTMVMNNDEATKRHGVQPTYKKAKGFQPLHIIWNGKIVDAVFRGGKKHSNAGDTVVNMVSDLVRLIREKYRQDVTIILRLDSGFFDEVNFKAFDKLKIGFVASGKIYESVKKKVKKRSSKAWKEYDNGHQAWQYLDFKYGCDSWNASYRAIYTRPLYDDQQRLLDFARPDNLILTNLEDGASCLDYCDDETKLRLLASPAIIKEHHQRGGDELPHRGLKDFGFEELPFKRFAANQAFYYFMVIAFFLFETFKEDVLADVIPIPLRCYATTVRRKIIDMAAKIVRTGHEIIFKVTQAVMEELRFDILWQKVNSLSPLII